MKQPILLSTLCAALVLGVSACGGQQAQNQTAAASSALPAGKDNIILNLGAEPESLDPHKAGESASFDVIRQLLHGLVATDGEGNTVPALAEKWESPDNKVWTFHLRDAKWHNGDPITAHDFVYSLRRLTDPATASPYASYLADAKVQNAAAVQSGKAKPESLGVTAINDKTLQITLSQALPYFPDMMLLPVTYPVHRATVEKHGDKWTQPQNYTANAAYALKEWTVNSQIILERSPAYYNHAHTRIKQIVFLPISDAAAALNRYRAGELDYAGVPPAQFQALKTSELANEMRTRPALCTFYYEPNHQSPLFQDVRVRRALNLAMNRDTIAHKVMGRGEQPAYQFTPPDIKGMGKAGISWQNQTQNERNRQAQQLLAAAGYSKDKPLRFELLYSNSDVAKQLVNASISLWQQALGADTVKIEAVSQEWKTSLETKRNGKFDMAFSGWCGDYNEASSFLNMLRANNGNNSARYRNPAFDQLLDTALNSSDAATRQRTYHQAEQQLEQDGAVIPLFQRISVSVLKPYVKGFSDNDPLKNWQVKDWYLQ
ncbi:ABC transporter substrate-binding protein [Conchiformibius steedae DSM 2580]|uniref:ABC transporter substrate-binding protein n=1 Tax=Conchiformibius steedae DSM 2580 TaxID=1121352 RepID=A0AAE9KXU6_9NEIS|nr:ABC transporter substrate-binding protein [Conchiformibius steedae]QMT34088.1 oligopeptide ABC transporter substrate-binding protein OppA [Conchiformibius steedae]URD66862.1 ABC transporter substrate-binding protein [Conchiformibius steedae DSM 2580]